MPMEINTDPNGHPQSGHFGAQSFFPFLAAVTSRTVKAVNVWLTVLLRYEGPKPDLLTCRVIHSCVITVIYS